MVQDFIQLEWLDAAWGWARGIIRCTGINELRWSLRVRGAPEEDLTSSHDPRSIRAALDRWLDRFPADPNAFTARWIKPLPSQAKSLITEEIPLAEGDAPRDWLADNIASMALALRAEFFPMGGVLGDLETWLTADQKRAERQARRREERRAEEETRRQATLARQAEDRRRREQQAAARKAALAKASAAAPAKARPTVPEARPRKRAPLPRCLSTSISRPCNSRTRPSC